jgi:hypothetical protein
LATGPGAGCLFCSPWSLELARTSTGVRGIIDGPDLDHPLTVALLAWRQAGLRLEVTLGSNLGDSRAQGLGAHNDALAVAGEDEQVALVTGSPLSFGVEGVEVGGGELCQLVDLALAQRLPRRTLDRLVPILEGTSRGPSAAVWRRPCEWDSVGRLRAASAGYRLTCPG